MSDINKESVLNVNIRSRRDGNALVKAVLLRQSGCSNVAKGVIFRYCSGFCDVLSFGRGSTLESLILFLPFFNSKTEDH